MRVLWRPPSNEASMKATERATLVVRSNVPDDVVFLDGRRYGPTPLEIEVDPGRYLLKVTKKGFADAERMVDLGPGGRIDGVIAQFAHVLDENVAMNMILAGRDDLAGIRLQGGHPLRIGISCGKDNNFAPLSG